YIGSSVFGGNSSDCNGGALAAAAPVTVERSELYGNQAGLACSELALGGAIYVENALWLTVSAVHDNVSAVAGGAIGILGNLNSPKTVEIRGSALYSNSATMAGAVAIGGPSVTHIEQSSIYSNTATMVGGIASGYGGATIDIVNSTLAGNSSGYMASALLVAGGNALEDNAGFGPDTLTLRNVTIAGNDRLGINAQNGDGFGAFANTDVGGKTATVGITNTIIAGGANEQSCYTGPLAIGSVPAAVSNLDNDGTCGSSFTQSDAILLGPLGDYGAVLQSGSIGGATPVTPTLVVFPLLPGSAAIDAGAGSLIATPPPQSACPFQDQRGVMRPQGSACDIGAFESQGFTLAKTGGDEQSTLWGGVFANPLAASVSSSHDEPV
ncbi:MAG: hypothetical protein KDD77_20045, partial [Caldilineaceae bacterium]|nr:hypothetical protein [Caldilineaceae bacterium]